MLKPFHQKRFVKDIKRIKKRGNDINKLEKIIKKLLSEQILPASFRNHKLKGEFKGYWECHIEPDWLLIYKKSATAITFVRTGTHADLFR